MTTQIDISKNNTVDSGLLGLVLIAKFHQIPVDQETLRHEFCPAVKKIGETSFFGDQEILLAAKSLELKAKLMRPVLKELDNAILPALCKTKEGQYFILIRKNETSGPSAIAIEAVSAHEENSIEPTYLVQFLTENKQQVEKLNGVDLGQFWNGEMIVISPRKSSILGKIREFNLSWFIPSLLKYRSLFGKVLLASFLIQLFGLITPLFFQVVMDKVLIHKAMTTLHVLVLGFGAATIFEVLLNGLRDHIFIHTTSRVDVELGARLFGHLMNLPLSWFQARQAGQSVARIRELDILRNFITSTALTLVIDLGFTVVYFIVMWFYSHSLTLIVLATIPFYVTLSIFITPILKSRVDKKFQYGAANQSFLVESITGVETIKSLALEPQKTLGEHASQLCDLLFQGSEPGPDSRSGSQFDPKGHHRFDCLERGLPGYGWRADCWRAGGLQHDCWTDQWPDSQDHPIVAGFPAIGHSH
jgi:subfamily B ATP-binding cassette protein HlyB/CyaB